MNEAITLFITSAMRLAIAALTSIVIYYAKTSLIPWLKEKQLYSTVQIYVNAAEKLCETGVIFKGNKRSWVQRELRNAGIVVDDRIDAMIEAAVEEIDKAKGELYSTLVGEEGNTDGDSAES